MTESLHFLSGAYAVDALDDLERVRFESHLGTCEDCREEVASLQITAAVLGGSATTPPPSDLRGDVLSAITKVRPLPPIVEPVTQPMQADARHRLAPTARRNDGPWRLTAVAAAVLAVACLSWAVVSQRGLSDSQQQVAAAKYAASQESIRAADALKVQALMGSSDLSISQSAAASDVKSFVFRSQKQGSAALVVMNLPDPGQGKIFQAWTLDSKHRPVGAGELKTSAGKAMILLGGNVDGATQVAVTIEPQGGSTQPTTAPVTQLDLA